MRQAHLVPNAPGRKVAGWMCLVAAFLMWSPFWATAWEAYGTNCCAGAMSPAHQHLKYSQDYPKSAQPSEASMLCEHHSDARVGPCSMSCCRTESHFAVASLVFELPQAVALWGS